MNGTVHRLIPGRWLARWAFLFITWLHIFVLTFPSPRSNLHSAGGMTSFIDTQRTSEGKRMITAETVGNDRPNAWKRFLETEKVKTGPVFPTDLGLEFTELKPNPGHKVIKAYVLSDLHADSRGNYQWVQEHCLKPDGDEVFSIFVIPGDVGSEVDRIEGILRTLSQSWDAVCYLPGNHEAWRRGTQLGTSTSATQPELRNSSTSRMSPDSVQKIAEVVEVARASGVYTGPIRVTLNNSPDTKLAIRIQPLYSWYHSSWDGEADLEDEAFLAVEESIPFHRKWGDFAQCTWPEELIRHEDFASTDNTVDNTALAEAWASLNEPFMSPIEEYSQSTDRERDGDTIITFSHFLPRQELIPEKRFLLEPMLANVVGSEPLRAQVERIRPDLHLYGHTHIPCDLELDGVRYIQWPLGYSREANLQCSPIRNHKALCVYDSSLITSPSDDATKSNRRGVPENMLSLEVAWSQYYRTQPREPAVVAPLAPWVLRRLESFAGFVRSRSSAKEGEKEESETERR